MHVLDSAGILDELKSILEGMFVPTDVPAGSAPHEAAADLVDAMSQWLSSGSAVTDSAERQTTQGSSSSIGSVVNQVAVVADGPGEPKSYVECAKCCFKGAAEHP